MKYLLLSVALIASFTLGYAVSPNPVVEIGSQQNSSQPKTGCVFVNNQTDCTY